MSAKRTLHAGMKVLAVLLLALATALVAGLAPAFAEDGALQVGEETPIEYAAQPVDDEALVHSVLDAAQALAPEAVSPLELLQAASDAMRADSSIAPDDYARVMAGVIEHLGYESLAVVAMDGSKTWNMVKVDDAWYHVDAERELVLVSDETVRTGEDGVAEWRVADETLEMELPPAPEDWQEEAAEVPAPEIEPSVVALADEDLVAAVEEPIQFEAVTSITTADVARVAPSVYTGSGQCQGYARYIGKMLTGTEPCGASLDGKGNKVNPNKGWTMYSSIDAAGGLRVGDMIRIATSGGGHAAIIYSVGSGSDPEIKVTEKWGSNSTIHTGGYLNGNKGGPFKTLSQIKKNATVYYVLRWSANSPVPIDTTYVTPNPNSLTEVPQRWFRIRPVSDPKMGLDIRDGSTANGANLQLWNWTGNPQQSFEFFKVQVGGYTAYKIHPVHASGKYLTVQYASLDSGANVFLWEDNGYNSQNWYFERFGDESNWTYAFRNVRSGKYLDVYANTMSNGTNIQQYEGNGSNAQRFYLIAGNPTLWDIKLSNSNNTYEYTGKPIDPNLKAYARPACPGYEIPKGQDYTVTYSNNVNVGTASWKILSIGYGSNNTATGTFKITPAPISKASIAWMGNQKYTGSAQTPKPTLTFNGMTLREGTDYTLSYKNNVSPGTATVTISGKGNFSGTKDVTFTIYDLTSVRIPNGTYIIQSMVGNRCLDFGSQGTNAGTNAQIYMPSGTGGQIFTIGWNSSLSANTIGLGALLSLRSIGAAAGSNVAIDVKNSSSDQAWFFEDAGDGYFFIRNGLGNYLDVKSGINADGTKVQTYSFLGGVAQKWKVIPVSGKAKETGIRGTYFLQSKVGNRVLDVSGGGSANRTNVQLWNPHFSTSHPEGEIFSINWNPSLSASNIMLVSAGKYIDHAGGKSEPNNVWLWEGNGGWNQNWFFENAGGGYYYVRDMLGYYLEVEGGVDANGTNVRAALFTGSNAQKWKLLDLDISRATVTGVSDKTYTGKAQTQSPVVKLNGITLQEGKDYALSYKNNTAVGTATITVTGKGSYTGTKAITFGILSGERIDIAKAKIAGILNFYYMDRPCEQSLTITYGGSTLKNNVDYTLSHKNNVEVGTATVTITGKGSYKGSVTKSFTIIKPDIGLTTIDYFPAAFSAKSIPNQAYTGKAIKPTMAIDQYYKADGMWFIGGEKVRSLQSGTDFTLKYKNNVNVGTAVITAVGKGNYTGEKSVEFKIVPAAISKAAAASISDQAYTGSALKPKPTLTFNGVTLKEGTDYTLSYKNNAKVGTATITVTGKGNFTGTKSVTFKIVEKARPDISGATVSKVADQTYTGKAITPKPTVKLGGATLKPGTDYTLSYKNNTKVGTATITITGKGDYMGTKSVTFKIVEEAAVPVYRLYNRKTSEHLYTVNKGEYDQLPVITKGDWVQEGIAWYAPKTSKTPVYRLYNKKSGDHHYTTSPGERDALVANHGWSSEGIAFYSDDQQRLPLYRVYNHRLQRGQHHYTAATQERDALTSKHGWKDEGIGFYGVRAK